MKDYCHPVPLIRTNRCSDETGAAEKKTKRITSRPDNGSGDGKRKEVTEMKKLIALLLVLCFSVAAISALAEDDMRDYIEDHPEAAAYVSAWVAENGDWRVEVFDEDGGLKMMIVHRLGDNKEDIWEYSAAMSPDNKLTAVPLGLHYKQDTVTSDWDVTYYEDGDAEFEITEDGKLVWKDLKEDAGKGLVFDKIGSFYGGRWVKGNTEVVFWDWYDGQYDVRMYQRGENNEIVNDAILRGEYDAETNSLTLTGEFENGEPINVTFTYDESNRIVWIENGESTVPELSCFTD